MLAPAVFETFELFARDVSDVEQTEHDGERAAERHGFFVEWHRHGVGPS